MITECCVCREYRDKDNHHRWYTPTADERRDNYFHLNKKISHSYCPICYLLNMKKEGFTDTEIEGLVKKVEAVEIKR
jgi:hypothetical protein